MRLIKPLPADLKTWATLLNQNFNDCVWLDSSNHHGQSLLAFAGLQTQIFQDEFSFNAFKEFFEKLSLSQNQDSASSSSKFFFEGGWIGYLSYECYAFNPLFQQKPNSIKSYPLSVWKYYDTFLIEQQNKLFFYSKSHRSQKIYDHLLFLFKKFKQKTNYSHFCKTKLTSTTDENLYLDHIHKIQNSLKSGDFFELNYSLEWHGLYSGNSFELYQKLRLISPAPMMSFFNWPEIQILSASPECFFKINPSGLIQTYPIKGTIQKSHKFTTDTKLKKRLLESQKDRSELLMVTDMLRNDLGRICKPGSIKTPHVFDLQSFSHYHHLVSHIEGQLKNSLTFYDIFCALFPGGSITGAPKVEVMKHIQNLEQRSRGVYTGALGYISDSGSTQLSIPIRTLTIHEEKLEFATGSGIVIDSIAQNEYQECQIKAKGILEALNERL